MSSRTRARCAVAPRHARALSARVLTSRAIGSRAGFVIFRSVDQHARAALHASSTRELNAPGVSQIHENPKRCNLYTAPTLHSSGCTEGASLFTARQGAHACPMMHSRHVCARVRHVPSQLWWRGAPASPIPPRHPVHFFFLMRLRLSPSASAISCARFRAFASMEAASSWR